LRGRSDMAARRRIKAAAAGLAACIAAFGHAGAAAGKALCIECIRVRLERPVVVRGPSRHEPDAPVSMIELPGGTIRAFAANGTTLAIDGPTPFALDGPGRVVLAPGPAGSPSECGQWLTSVLQGRDGLYGVIHNEQHCNYRKGETYKSMSIARSLDRGLTWDVLGQIIRADAPFISGQAGGEGDCTAVDGHDGYWYAYCLRLRDWKNFVARARADDPAPGKWAKWSGDGFNAPALGGTASALSGIVGMSSAYWSRPGAVLLLSTTSAMRLSISQDKIHFATLAEPVILYDGSDWNRPAPTDLYAYPSMIAPHGFSDIAQHFFLTYTYIAPGEDFRRRYLVVQEGQIELAPVAPHPQVRTALSRWIAAGGAKWATTGPAISSSRSYSYDGPLGYLMTAPPGELPSVRLDECFSARSGAGFLVEEGGCAAAGSERRRTGGYAFRSREPGTIALLSCIAPNGQRFNSTSADCENVGTRERILGYALR
jgi:hypothetical protein